MQPLLALADDDNLPNYDAIALSPGVGWLLFAAVICLALFFIAHRDAWRKLWMRMDDPRPMSAMRILFGFCALCNVNGLWELFEYLFMDEGLFTTDLAQHYRARSQFAGFGDGTAETEPWSFFSFGAFVEWLKGSNYSLLLFNSTPTFFWGYWVALQIAMLMFIVGWQTKWIKWIAWFLYMGIILRNTLFWEATENVYRVFFFYLCLSRCGEGWSVDNWLRCRKLEKAGRLSLPDGPGGGAGAVVEEDGVKKFFEPIYRPIPGWPRLFVMLNVSVLYCATGTLKNGPVWNRGDAFYYAFNLDHFYRLPPQQLSAYFGTTLFKLNTFVVHWWESLFPVVMLGLILRWHRREKIPRLEGWKKWLGRVGLGGFVFWFYCIILYSYPVHYRAPARGVNLGWAVYHGDDAIPVIQTIVGIGVPLLAALVVWGYRKLRDRQDVALDQRYAADKDGAEQGKDKKDKKGKKGKLRAWARKHQVWIDLDWVCRWPLGRRIWLMLGLIFHGHLILTMNVGWFSPGLLACYPAFLNGDEWGFITAKTGQLFAKHKQRLFAVAGSCVVLGILIGIANITRSGFGLAPPIAVGIGLGLLLALATIAGANAKFVPSADHTLPSQPKSKISKGWKVLRDGYEQPLAVIFTALGLAAMGVVARTLTDENWWVRLGNLVENTAKMDLPVSLTDQAPVIHGNWFVLMIAVMTLVVIIRRTRGFDFNPWFSPVILLAAGLGSVLAARGLVGMIWVSLAVGVLSYFACWIKAKPPAPLPERDPETGRINQAWAYGPIGRTFVSLVAIYHLCAVASTQFPDKDSWSTFHRDVDDTFKHWLRTTQSTQGWGMFAPNPPRSNVFLRVTVTDKNGEIFDLNTDVYACLLAQAEVDTLRKQAQELASAENLAALEEAETTAQGICDAVYPIPWTWYTRQRKINRRIAGSEGGHGSWYQKWHARWVCRQWELEHGELPRRVELYKVVYPMASPKEVGPRWVDGGIFGRTIAFNPYDPKTQYNTKGSHKKLHTTECKGAVSGQLSNEFRLRHGLEKVDEDSIRVWNKHRCRSWEAKLIEEAREKARKRGEEIDILDPKFDVCPGMTKEVRKAMFERGDGDLLLDDDD